MKKIYLTEEGYPHCSLTEDGVITNEKTGRLIKVKSDGCFELQWNKIRKSFSLKRLLSKYFSEENLGLTPIPGFEGKYSATKDGRVFGHLRSNFLSPYKHISGYYYIHLEDKSYLLHRIIALTFIPNPEGLAEINHIDENKENCCVENLEWCDRKYNVNYGTRSQRVSETNKIVMKQWHEERKKKAGN